LPEAFLVCTEHPLVKLVRRYARTHGPLTTADLDARFAAHCRG
jgi:hypothetical protein